MDLRGSTSRMTIDIPKEDHKRLKALSAVLGKSMKDIMLEWMHEHLYSYNTPNTETLQAINQIECKKNLVECENIDDLFKRLGI